MWLKWTKRILATLGILIVLLVSFTFIVIYVYEDEIKEYATKQLNEHLKVAVFVKPENIELTLMDQFPEASLRFTDVLIPDYTSEGHKDTLFFAKQVYFNFNFWDMMGGNYKVTNVHLKDAVAHIVVTEDGTPNYDIWKSDTIKKSENNKFSFALEKLTGTNLSISYHNRQKDQYYAIQSEDVNFAGNFNESQYDLEATSKMIIQKVRIDSTDILTNKEGSIDFAMRIDHSTNTYSIKKGDLAVEEIIFGVKGKYIQQEDSSSIDLAVKGKNIDLESAFTIFPEKFTAPLQKYDAKGIVVFESQINGLVGAGNTPRYSANFWVVDGKVTEKQSGVSLSKITFEAYYDSDTLGTSILEMTDFGAQLDVGTLEGTLKLTDLTNPQIEAHTKGDINLKLLQNFLQNENIETLGGNTKFTFDFKGKSSPTGLAISTSKGVFDFKDAVLKLPTSPILYSAINGKFVIDKNNAAIKGLKGIAQTSDFELSGSIDNLIPYVLTTQEVMSINATLSSQKVDLDELLATTNEPDKPWEVSNEPAFSLPSNINLDLKSTIKELNYGKFNTKKITGTVKLKNKVLTASNFEFKANKGTYNCSLGLEQLENKSFIWNTDVKAKGVDIQNLFTEMDNFGQVYLTDANIKGTGDFDLSMAMGLDKNLTPIVESLKSRSSITLKKGELINQSTLVDIGAYFAENKVTKKLLNIENLQSKIAHVKFKDLSNTITIEDGKIYIPKMLISSNVMDISLGGWHSFEDSIDYHFNFKIRDVLVNKESSEFGAIKDDGLGVKLFLRMFGTLENPQYEMDKEERKLELKENLINEKRDVKSILKSEIGLFKKDTLVGVYIEPKKAPVTFVIETDEDTEPAKVKTNTEIQKEKALEEEKKKNNKFNKFLNKIGVEEEKKKPVEIEMDN